MARIDRRSALKGAAAGAAVIICEVISKPLAAAIIPRQACGCPRIHELAYGHTCIVHDEAGRRWDSYTFEEIAKSNHEKIDVQTAKTEWSCYCAECDKLPDNIMLVGTKCVWEKTSYEYDEWECYCAEEYRQRWLSNVTIDWIAAAKENGLA